MNRNKPKKFIAVSFIILMFFVLCVSCAENQNEGSAETNDGSEEHNIADDTANTEEEPEEIKMLPDLPEVDFGGYEFKVITSDYIADTIMPREISAEEETGEPINDAIFRRNKHIEEKYDVLILEILHPRDELNNPVRRAVQSSDNAYDLIAGNIRELGILAQSSALHDLTRVNHLDLAKPWYDQNAASDLSVGNKVFFAVGDLQISNKDGTWSVLFNKQLHQNLNLDDPYPLVIDGNWTMDKMFEMAAAANSDLNGDGVMDEEDQWGMLGEEFNIWALMNGSGTRLVQKDENDLPFYAGYTQRDTDIFEKALDYLGDRGKSMLATHYTGKYGNVWNELINPIFATDRILFFFTSLSRVTWHRDMDTDFGILPVPKYEAAQTGYVSTVSVWLACGMGIPVSSDGADLDRTAVITEALNAESMYTLTPAYYDTQLKTKLTRDNESAEMLDIIFASRIYSPEQLYNWGEMISTITGLLTGNNRNFVSAMDRIENRIVSGIERTIETFEN